MRKTQQKNKRVRNNQKTKRRTLKGGVKGSTNKYKPPKTSIILTKTYNQSENQSEELKEQRKQNWIEEIRKQNLGEFDYLRKYYLRNQSLYNEPNVYDYYNELLNWLNTKPLNFEKQPTLMKLAEYESYGDVYKNLIQLGSRAGP